MIHFKEPLTQKRKLKFWVGMLVFTCFLGFIGNGWNGVLYIFPIGLFVLALFIGISEYLEKQFDGWLIENDSISLIRISLLGEQQEQTLKFNSIDSILYIKPAARRPFSFKFKSKNKTYWLLPSMDIYEFSETLKYLKDQGIKIEFFEKDHEVELFLDERIDSIPMTNDMKIKN